MKLLYLTEEAEKVLSQIVDAALKAGGLPMHGLVNQLVSYMKEEPDPIVQENKDGN